MVCSLTPSNVIRHVIEYKLLTERESNLSKIRTLNVKWYKPSPGWYKLNTNGAYEGNLLYCSFCGVLRNYNGDWIVGFSKCAYTGSATQTDYWLLWKDSN